MGLDVPQIEVMLLKSVTLGLTRCKGIGELGISGAAASITNAIYNACGVRVRDYPATLDRFWRGCLSGVLILSTFANF